MSSDADRQEIADRLLALPLPELVDVMSRVLPQHRQQDERRGRALMLAQLWWPGPDGPTPDDEVELVAWPDRDSYDGGFGGEPTLWESGSCPMCGADVVSTAKRATCPVCGSTCWLT